MSKRKIKIRYIVILPVLICALIFIRKLKNLRECLITKKRDLCSRSSIRADGVKEPLYQWEHANMTSFSVGRRLR